MCLRLSLQIPKLIQNDFWGDSLETARFPNGLIGNDFFLRFFCRALFLYSIFQIFIYLSIKARTKTETSVIFNSFNSFCRFSSASFRFSATEDGLTKKSLISFGILIQNNQKMGEKRSHRDLNSDCRIQSPEC